MSRPQTQPQTQKNHHNGPATKTAAPPVMDAATRDRISKRAFEIYNSRGGEQGDPVQDWLQAERELRLGRQ
jgi:hypothetical protein